MNAQPHPSASAEINRLHAEAQTAAAQSRGALNTALVAAWQAGQLLVEEKKRVRHIMGPSSWLLWLDANFKGTRRTAQRYMKLARSVTDAAFLQGLSLRQVYARLGIATEPKRLQGAPLAHRLPAHLLLANRLVRSLHPLRTVPADNPAWKDLKPLYELLRQRFAPAGPTNTGVAGGKSMSVVR